MGSSGRLKEHSGMQPSKAWLELDYDCYYGGEEIAGKLYLQAASDGTLPLHLAVIQFGGTLSVEPTLIDPVRFGELKRSPSYARDSLGIGGGKLFRKDAGKANPNEVSVYSTAPSIVTAAVVIDAGKTISYEWRLGIAPEAFPTLEGRAVNIAYRLLVSIELSNGKVTSFERPIFILPFYNQESTSAPVSLYNVHFPYASSQDTSESWPHIVEVDKLDKIPSPSERLKQNQVLSFDLLNSFYSLNPAKRDAVWRKSLDDQCFELLGEVYSGAPFEIKRGDDLIAMLSLLKSNSLPGELINLNLNFKDASLTTFQLSVTLEEYEAIPSAFAFGSQDVEVPNKISIAYQEEVVWMRDRIGFTFGIPLDTLPTTHTTIGRHQFRLRLVLYVADPRADIYRHLKPDWLGCTPDVPFIERFECCIPLVVLPGRPNRLRRPQLPSSALIAT